MNSPLPIQNPVPAQSVPAIKSAKVLAECGPAGWMVEIEYADGERQRFPWALYMQSGHAASIAIVHCDEQGRERISLTRQWRPGDRNGCIELPAGNIGLGNPQALFARTLKSVLAEAGELEVVSAWTGRGVAHDVGREIAGRVISVDKSGSAEIETEGFKLFLPFVLKTRAILGTNVHDGVGDEHLVTNMYLVDDVLEMLARGDIYDVITSHFLPAAIALVRGEQTWRDRQFAWTPVPTELIDTSMVEAKRILAQTEGR